MAVTISTIIDSEVFSSTPETYTVTNEGYVYDKGGGSGFDLGGIGIFSLTINGIVDSAADGINLYGTPASGASKVVVGVNGQVNSSLGHSLDADHATNLTHSGTMGSAEGVRPHSFQLRLHQIADS